MTRGLSDYSSTTLSLRRGALLAHLWEPRMGLLPPHENEPQHIHAHVRIHLKHLTRGGENEHK